jgi:diacylglycerol kinase (ATP)
MQVLLLHNPKAGMADHPKEDLVASLGFHADVTYCSTKSDDFPDCLSGDFDAVIIAGGDGTVAGCLKKLPDRCKPVGIIPLGGANNIATSLGLSGPHKIATWLKARTVTEFSAGTVSGPWGSGTLLEGVGLGALAESFRARRSRETSVAEKILNGRRNLAAGIARLEAVKCDVTIDGDVLPARWLMVEALLTSHTGPRLPLAQKPEGVEGRFSVVLLEDERRHEMLEWLISPDQSSPPLMTRVGTDITIEVDRKLSCRVDDKTRSFKGGRIDLSIAGEPFRLATLVQPEASR